MVTVAAVLFLLGWFLLSSLPWLTRVPTPFVWRVLYWIGTAFLVLPAGWVLDTTFVDKPHTAWSSLEFYLTLISLHAVFAVPAFVFWFSRRQPHAQ